MIALAKLAEIYDVQNCPRADGGRLIDRGEIVNRPGEYPQRFFACSRCDKWWTVIELRRRPTPTSEPPL